MIVGKLHKKRLYFLEPKKMLIAKQLKTIGISTTMD
jgi:hypothetical protein